MSGFKSDALNIVFGDGVINIIIAHLIKCSTQMKKDCLDQSNPLHNHEDKITNRLTAEYLNAQPSNFRYITQTLEHYEKVTAQYVGRTDIMVISNDYFRDTQAYHIIECKRIDGSTSLNRKYVSEGVARFISTTQKQKYSSYYSRNIMFGYVIKTIDIPSNTEKIVDMQSRILEDTITGDFALLHKDDSHYYVYSSKYQPDASLIELVHLFYDFSDVVSM